MVKKNFKPYRYEGDPVLASGGDSELFTVDILGLDAVAQPGQRIESVGNMNPFKLAA